MEPLRNNSLNQSYYDPADDVCSAEPTASSGGVDTTTSAGGQSSPGVPEPAPSGVAPLVDAYYHGQGGTASVAPSDAPGAPVTAEDSTGEAATLCDRRLAANRFICGIGGSLIAERLGMGGFKGAGAAYAISDGCVRLADWLEHNAPLGACEK